MGINPLHSKYFNVKKNTNRSGSVQLVFDAAKLSLATLDQRSVENKLLKSHLVK